MVNARIAFVVAMMALELVLEFCDGLARRLTLEVSDGTVTSSDDVVISIADTQAPVITLNGAATVTIELGSSFVHAGASAVDACVGSVTVQASGSVNGNAVGDYTITYSANDGHGNSSSATRVVRVRDTQVPVITVSAAPLVLWSPNHKYATVALSGLGISVSDAGGASAQDVVITKVTSDEPDNGLGDGDTANDIGHRT